MFLKITKFEALWTKFNNCPQKYFHYQKYRNEHAGFKVTLPLFVLTFTIFWMTVFTAKQFLIPARAKPCTHSSTHTPVHHLHAHSFPQPLYLRACNKHSKISVNLKGPLSPNKKIFYMKPFDHILTQIGVIGSRISSTLASMAQHFVNPIFF